MSTDFTSRLLGETPDAVIAIAPDGKAPHWNCAAENIFGYTRDEAMGRLLIDLIVPPELVEEERRILADALVRGLVVYEALRRRKDGSLVYINGSIKAVRDSSGGIEYFLFTKKDVTHLKVLRDAKQPDYVE